MTRSQRIADIAGLAGHREREASRALADAQRELAECERLLAELTGYRADYLSRDRVARAAQIGALAMQDYHRFIARLGEAIAGQTERVRQARAHCEQRRAALAEARQRNMSLDKAVTRFRRIEADQEARREQATLDDMGALMRQQHTAR